MTLSRDKLLTWLVLLAVLACGVAHVWRADESDKNWILYWASLTLDGKQLYTQALSVLPPMIFWIYSIPVALSRLTGIADQHLLMLLGAVMIFFTCRLCIGLLGEHPVFKDNARRKHQVLLLLIMTFVAWFDSQSFMDREHIFFVLSFPYMLRMCPGLFAATLPTRQRVQVAALCGIGLCIKPHLLLLFLAIQAAVMLSRRSLSILFSLENVIIYAMGAAYLLVVIVCYPAYFTLVLPMAAATYTGVTDTAQKVNFALSTCFIFVLSFVHFRWRRKSPYRADIYYFLALCGAWLAYAIINNGWYYTWAPLGALILFITGWVVWENNYFKEQAGDDTKLKRDIFWGQIACWINMVWNSFVPVMFSITLFSMGCHEICHKVQVLSNGVKHMQVKNFGAISIEFAIWADVARKTGAKWDTRINHLWMLPAILKAPDGEHHFDSVMKYIEQSYAEDLTQNRPDIVFVDDTYKFYDVEKDVNLVTLLSADKAFADAWSNYEYITSVNRCPASRPQADKPITYDRKNCKYDVFRRKDLPKP